MIFERIVTVRTTDRLRHGLLSSTAWSRPLAPQVRHYRKIVPRTARPARRHYATEALSLPDSVNLNLPPPSAPTVQSAHPESAHGAATSIDDCLASIHRNLQTAARPGKDAKTPSVTELYELMRERAGRVLEEELPYEDTPDRARRVNTRRFSTAIDSAASLQSAWLETCQVALRSLKNPSPASVETYDAVDDGLVVLAHVIQGKQQEVIVSWSLGFVVECKGGRQHIVSCSHTLESAAHSARARAKSSTYLSSSSLAVSRSGCVLPIASVESSLPLSDILIYSFDRLPHDGSRKLKSMPVGLYPPQIGTRQNVFLIGQEAEAREAGGKESLDGWTECNVIGYKDPRGNDAEPGTYDELTSLVRTFTSFDGMKLPDGHSHITIVAGSASHSRIIWRSADILYYRLRHRPCPWVTNGLWRQKDGWVCYPFREDI